MALNIRSLFNTHYPFMHPQIEVEDNDINLKAHTSWYEQSDDHSTENKEIYELKLKLKIKKSLKKAMLEQLDLL